jgi:putative addiction module CopG family antidote
MTETFPREIQRFVQQELASGVYRSEEELVLDAVRLLRNSKRHLEHLRQELATRLKSLEHGDGVEVDEDKTLGQLFDDIEAEVAGTILRP